MCGEVIYPTAILNITNNVDLSKEFIEYLKSENSKKIFINVGFTPLT